MTNEEKIDAEYVVALIAKIEMLQQALTNIKNVKLYNYVFDGYEKEIQRLATEALESK